MQSGKQEKNSLAGRIPCSFRQVHVMPMSKVVILRKELYKMYSKLDDMTSAKQCGEAKVKTH